MEKHTRIYVLIMTFFVILGCLGAGLSYVSARNFSSRNADNLQSINARTPALFSQSYQAIATSMSMQERAEFLLALNKIMRAHAADKTDADAEFRQHINGKTVSAIIMEAKEIR